MTNAVLTEEGIERIKGSVLLMNNEARSGVPSILQCPRVNLFIMEGFYLL
jgi:hypothetical protein